MGLFGRNSGGEINENDIGTGNEIETIEKEPTENDEEQLSPVEPEGGIETTDDSSDIKVADAGDPPPPPDGPDGSDDPDDQLNPKEELSPNDRFRDSMKLKQSPEEIQAYNAENGYPQPEERKKGGVERQPDEDDPRWEAYNTEDDGDQ